MFPPNTNELRQHSDDLAKIGKSLHDLNGAGKVLVNLAVAVVASMVVVIFLSPIFAAIV
jgi:hypothetical protein